MLIGLRVPNRSRGHVFNLNFCLGHGRALRVGHNSVDLTSLGLCPYDATADQKQQRTHCYRQHTTQSAHNAYSPLKNSYVQARANADCDTSFGLPSAGVQVGCEEMGSLATSRDNLSLKFMCSKSKDENGSEERD